MSLNFNLGSPTTAQNILRSGYLTVGEALRVNAKVLPTRLAVEYDGGQLTFAQLNSLANKLANAFGSLGIKRGDRVAVLSENRMEYCLTAYAAAKLGAIVPCLNWRQAADELSYCIKLTTPATILVSSLYRNNFEEIRDDLPFIKTVVWFDEQPEREGEMNFSALLDQGVDRELEVEVLPEDALTIIYTSGTTGYPKAAIVSHRGMFGRAWAWVCDLNLNEKDTFLAWAPMFHMASMDQMMVNHILGGKVICIPGFEPEKLAYYAFKEWLGWFILMPGCYEPMIEIFSKADRKPVGAKYVGAMADLTPPATIAEITRLTNSPFLNSFGSTETGLPPASASTFEIGKIPTDFSKRVSTTCQIKLVDHEDNIVPIGEPGEMAMRGPSLCSGYWNNEEANREDFRNGWFHMGDVFSMNPDGRINFVDRRKYLIKSGGENIYPAEVERVLMRHPAVLEAVVVRYPDPKWGETPKAYIATSQPIDQEELMDLCRKNLAGYKRPRYIEFIPLDKFPRSTTGKVQRHEIEKWHKA